ncbi:MAG: hypothetical protein ACJAWW_000915 [Sulfurimonas sp.]|jgi:uncharacterized protein (DUF302 family)
MIYITESQSSITTIKEEMALKAKEVGFGLLKEYSFREMLKEKGFPIEKDITVFELCNPAAAQKVLSTHPELSVYLPCRISVYEKDEKIILSTVDIAEMLSDFELDNPLKEQMNNIFNNLKKIMSSWK